MTELTTSKEQYSDKGHNDGFHNPVYGKGLEFSIFIAKSCTEQLYDRPEENTTAVTKMIFTLFRIWNDWSV